MDRVRETGHKTEMIFHCRKNCSKFIFDSRYKKQEHKLWQLPLPNADRLAVDSSTALWHSFSTNSSAFPAALFFQYRLPVFSYPLQMSAPRAPCFLQRKKKTPLATSKKNDECNRAKLLSPRSAGSTRSRASFVTLCFSSFEKLGCIRLPHRGAHLAQMSGVHHPPLPLLLVGFAWALLEFDFLCSSLQGEPPADAQALPWWCNTAAMNETLPPLEPH